MIYDWPDAKNRVGRDDDVFPAQERVVGQVVVFAGQHVQAGNKHPGSLPVGGLILMVPRQGTNSGAGFRDNS